MRGYAGGFLLAGAILAVIISLITRRVSWIGEREVCGQMRIVDKGKQTVLRNAGLLVYRSKSKYTPCCVKAKGNFKSGDLEAGRYFIVAEHSDPKFVIPVWLEKHYDGRTCGLSTVFTFDRATGKTEATITILVESPRNAQIH